MSPTAKNNPFAFPSTRWTQVDLAGVKESSVRLEAIENLVVAYLAPLERHLVVRMKLSVEEAQDIVQSFVADKILSKNLIASADRQKGRFRTFVLTSLDRFCFDQLRKRRRRRHIEPGTADDGEEVFQIADPHDPRDSDVFDVAWGREVIRKVLSLMKADCKKKGQTAMWGIFEDRVVGPLIAGRRETPYKDLVTRFDLKSPGEAGNLFTTAKRKFRRILDTVVSEYSADDVEGEIRELYEVLARNGVFGPGPNEERDQR